MRGDSVKQALGDFVGVAVQKADPFFVRGFDLREAGEKGREAVLHSQVFAETCRVLTNQIDFADALRKQAGGFANDRFETAAAKLAAVLRNHTEGAGMIAAFGDL